MGLAPEINVMYVCMMYCHFARLIIKHQTILFFLLTAQRALIRRHTQDNSLLIPLPDFGEGPT